MLVKAACCLCLCASIHMLAASADPEQEKVQKQEICIEVRDEENREAAIGNALFGIYDPQGEELLTCRSDSEGKLHISPLAYGTYRLRLLSNVPGYKRMKEDISFYVSEKTYHLQIFLEKKERLFLKKEDYTSGILAAAAFFFLIMTGGCCYAFYIKEEKEPEN